MDSNEKRLLENNSKLLKENNELLRKIHGIQRWSQITKIVYWIIILGIAFGSFYFIQPYIDNILRVYSTGVSEINTIKNISKKLNTNNSHNLVKNKNQ